MKTTREIDINHRGANAGNPLRRFADYKKYYELTIMFIPVIVYYIIFHYLPMYGVTLAFKDFNLKKGIIDSPWVGLKHFYRLFESSQFTRALRNTIEISLMRITFGFPMPLILALLLNEIKNMKFKKTIQTISYLPHFLSWIVLSGIFTQLLSPSNGMINYILGKFRVEPIYFMADNKWFRPVLITTGIWQSIGWSSIIYLAAISGINPEMYEAAECEGAGRFQKMWYITLPSILPTIMFLLIMNVGQILNAGFDQIFNMYNDAVMETTDILDTYVHRRGLGRMEYSLGTATGLFKNLIGFFLIIITNAISKRLSDFSLW